MKKTEILEFLNKNVKIVCSYPSETFILKGKILSVNEETILFLDFKTSKKVLIDLSVVKEVWDIE